MWNPFPMMFHPTLIVEDLEQSSAWFSRVFGRPEVRWENKWDLTLLNPTYPINYSYFYVLGDVSLDVLCPSLLVLPGGKKAVYPEGEGLSDIAWYTDRIEEVSRQLETHGFRTRDQEGNIIHDGVVPESNLVADCPMIWSLPEDTGLTYEFYDMARRHWDKYSEHADPRLSPNWRPDRVVEDDPLGIVRTAYHTILTKDRARAKKLFADVLDGKVVDEFHDPEMDADCVEIAYAKSVLRFATPRTEPIMDVLTGEPTHTDQYLGITFDVLDVKAAAAHLEHEGVSIVHRQDQSIVTDPTTSKGVVWGFRTA
ncbi:catechol 2,3-dioxygenase-like lactoylglutathione lyase family enzyme [Arthrobacter globiformis]|uniref:VOC family protein n=1 Tax=Arthrobacter globiformis TaxID=1665 RepID=UPI002789F235|nr:VOC family protein [Arthrobacter globiformis]MDQ1058223.1 catechol 2,3-dioxygenase-like lactoylglutathione lyase family enzyme [Arthrobacter globiformis]